MRGHNGEHFCDNCGDEPNNAKNKGEHDEGDPDCAEDADEVRNPDCCDLRPLLRAANPPSKDEPELEPSREEVAAMLTTLYRALLEEKKTHPAPTEKREERQEAKKQENEERKSWSKTIETGEHSRLPSEACAEHMRVPSENPQGWPTCREPTLKFALLEAPTSQSSSSLCQCMHMLAAFISQERVTAAVKKVEDLRPFPPDMSAEDEAWDEKARLTPAKEAGTYQGKANFRAQIPTLIWVLTALYKVPQSLAERMQAICFSKLKLRGGHAMESEALKLHEIKLIIAFLEKKGCLTLAAIMADELELRRCPVPDTGWADPASAPKQKSDRNWQLRRPGADYSDSERCTRACENTFIYSNGDTFVCFRQCCLSRGHEGFCRCLYCARNRVPREQPGPNE